MVVIDEEAISDESTVALWTLAKVLRAMLPLLIVAGKVILLLELSSLADRGLLPAGRVTS